MNTEKSQIELWGVYDLVLEGTQEGNPFVDISLKVQFHFKHRTIEVDGFYDGDGIYRIRFMPDTQGEWTCTTRSNCAELDGKITAFECVAPTQGNHGPVRVAHTYHFAYEDGNPYRPVGTTCYNWTH